jgi:hypothetical protein
MAKLFHRIGEQVLLDRSGSQMAMPHLATETIEGNVRTHENYILYTNDASQPYP